MVSVAVSQLCVLYKRPDFNDETSDVCHVVFCPVVFGVTDVACQRFTDIRAGLETAMKQRQGGV